MIDSFNKYIEKKKALTEKYQQEVAFTIFKGINDYCGVLKE